MATNFLEFNGTNGFLAAPFPYVTAEFSGNNTVTTTSVQSFTQTSGTQAQAIWGNIAFTCGSAGMTPVAGGLISGWFLYSPDGGTTFETTVQNVGLPRSPDFIIPLYASAYASGNISTSNLVRLPWWTYRVFVQNNAGSGVSIPTGSAIKVGPVAIQY